jgi:hypothetical protein
VSKFIPIPLLMTVWSLPVAVAYPADAPDNVPPRRTLDLRPPDLRSLHVQDLQQVAISADSDDAVTVAIAAAQLLPENSGTHLSLTGLGSLYWAAHHPTQAWRVLLPIQPDAGSDASADNQTLAHERYEIHQARTEFAGKPHEAGRVAERATPETLTERREINAKPSPTTLAPETGGRCFRRTQIGEAT